MIPPRIILTGDQKNAAMFVKFGSFLLDSLQQNIDRMGLFQLSTYKMLPGGGTIHASVIGNERKIKIFMPSPIPEVIEPVEEIEEYDNYETKYLIIRLKGEVMNLGIYINKVIVFDITKNMNAKDIKDNNGDIVTFPAEWQSISNWYSETKKLGNSLFYREQPCPKDAHDIIVSQYWPPVGGELRFESNPYSCYDEDGVDTEYVNSTTKKVIKYDVDGSDQSCLCDGCWGWEPECGENVCLHCWENTSRIAEQDTVYPRFMPHVMDVYLSFNIRDLNNNNSSRYITKEINEKTYSDLSTYKNSESYTCYYGSNPYTCYRVKEYGSEYIVENYKNSTYKIVTPICDDQDNVETEFYYVKNMTTHGNPQGEYYESGNMEVNNIEFDFYNTAHYTGCVYDDSEIGNNIISQLYFQRITMLHNKRTGERIKKDGQWAWGNFVDSHGKDHGKQWIVVHAAVDTIKDINTYDFREQTRNASLENSIASMIDEAYQEADGWDPLTNIFGWSLDDLEIVGI